MPDRQEALLLREVHLLDRLEARTLLHLRKIGTRNMPSVVMTRMDSRFR